MTINNSGEREKVVPHIDEIGDTAQGNQEPSLNIEIEDIDDLKEFTDKRVIEFAGGDLVAHVEDDVRKLQEEKKRAGTYYQNLIFALMHIRLPEDEARRDWNEILKHKYTVSQTLGRNLGIHVATLDYYINIKRTNITPKIIDAHEYADTASQAITDELTRAYNRAFFDDEFKRHFLLAKTTGRTFGLLMLDLDHFKLYNDINGHIRGDIALMEFVRILHTICSRAGIVARFGGEEFVVILLDNNIEQALATAEQIRDTVFDYRFVDEQHMPERRLTVSIGVTAFRPDISKPSEMLEEADVALYRAKNGGRNRVKAFLKGESDQNAQAPGH
jgi:diguanylate cyclase (GGDEF)-like protein